MDFQNRVGHKTGSGAPASAQDVALDRKERLRRLALETLDLSKDPYLMRNHIGQFECRLCLTMHPNEASYLSHTQGKKHQTNLAKRAARERSDIFGPQPAVAPSPKAGAAAASGAGAALKIGRPGYRVLRLRQPDTDQRGLRFELDFPDIAPGTHPRHRHMSTWEQKLEPPDPRFQFVLFAADPYETVAFKVPNEEIERHERSRHYFFYWNADTKKYTLQFLFKGAGPHGGHRASPGPAAGPMATNLPPVGPAFARDPHRYT